MIHRTLLPHGSFAWWIKHLEGVGPTELEFAQLAISLLSMLLRENPQAKRLKAGPDQNMAARSIIGVV